VMGLPKFKDLSGDPDHSHFRWLVLKLTLNIAYLCTKFDN